MKDARARRTAQDTSAREDLHDQTAARDLRRTSPRTGSAPCCATALQTERSGRPRWDRRPTRATRVSGNYFDQGGVIPGQGYTPRRRRSRRSITRRTGFHIGLSANGSRINHGSGRRRRRVRLRARNDAARTSDELHEPRLGRPARSASRRRSAQHQSGARGAVGRSPADRQPRLRLGVRRVQDHGRVDVSRELRSRLHAAHERLLQRPVDARHLREPRREQHEPGRSRRRPDSSTSRTSRTRSTTSCARPRRSARCMRFDLTGLYSIQHDRFTKDSLYATNLPYTTQLWYDLGSGTAGQRSEPHLRVDAAVVHGPRELHVQRSVLAVAHGPHRRLEPSGAGTQVGVLPVGRPRVAARRRAVHAALRLVQLAQAARELRHDGQHVDQSVSDARHARAAALHVRRRRACAATSRARSRIRISGGRRPIRPTSASTIRCFDNRISGTVDWLQARTRTTCCCTRLLAGDVGLHVDAAERRLDGEHRHRARALDGEPPELARPDLDDRYQLVAQHEQDHRACRAARRRTSATSGSSASRSISA